MVFEHVHYRNFLRSELLRRQKENKSYSMRAFARQLGLGQSAVSQILAGKKNLSIETAAMVAQSLKLDTKESEYFRLLVMLDKAKSPEYRATLLAQAQAMNPKKRPKDLSVDLFSAIADWHHLVIRNMTNLKGMKFNSQTIAKKLGISPLAAEDAIDRLLRLELIEPDPKHMGKMRRVEDYVIAKSAVANEALRHFHRQMLNKAIESLETQSPQEKFIGSETFAISSEQIPKAFQMADEFLTKLAALANQTKEPNKVYHLGLQFFNLTRGS